MELKDGIKTFHAPSREAWRNWLEKNHTKEKSLWLILYNKRSGVPSIDYATAVEEALCFGWIDSKPNKRDAQSSYQYFSPRKPKSNWSGLNKQRVEKLLKEKRMAPAGLAMVALAKQTGTWDALNDVEQQKEPPDLLAALNKNKTARKNWDAFPPSTRRGILDWIQSAKKPETREKRIQETASLAAKNIRANQYVKK